jgi:hypothetical protein
MKKLYFLLFTFISFSGLSQNFEYNVLFEGIGDNREYFNNYGFPQTILGARAAAEAGFSTENHRIRLGLSYLYEFGSEADTQKPKPILYYQFSNVKTDFLFGAFPRRDKIDFPLAMLTDTLLYYRPNIEGVYGKQSWKWGWQNGFIDWLQRQTDVNREMFTAGTSGEMFAGRFFIENYLLITHVANPGIRIEGQHIKDYIGFSLRAGVRTKGNIAFKGYLKAGILNSEYRERSVTDGFEIANSFFAEAFGEWKSLAVKTVLHSGESQNFAFGDNFYHAKNYSRTDLIWNFVNKEKIKGRFNWSLHVIDWQELNNQQQLSIIYVFGK